MGLFTQTTLPAHVRAPRGGRPTEYRPEYCQAVIDLMAQGFSLTAFAASICVAKDTVYEWIKVHPQFSDAVARARAARVYELETKLLRSRVGAETSAAIFALRNADPTEWRDIKHIDPVPVQHIEPLTDAQLHAIAARELHPVEGLTGALSERADEKDAIQLTACR
jgi:hypothetical protein